MKSYSASFKFLLLSFFSVVILSMGCKKDKTHVNITLWNQPLETIKQNIQGDWKFIKVTEGLLPSFVQYINNGELNISGERVQLWGEGHVLQADTTIDWTRIRSSYFGDSTYLMSFYALTGGYTFDFTVNEIKNDTLITRINADDGQKFFFIKK